jgi:4,5:9,10-diseco-3-hydroxy-5,9,17-trioxoandrosta-1(10),2-diene-4-oate hydrolase
MINQSLVGQSLRRDVGVQQPLTLLAANGTEVAVSRWGSGTPVVCLHATGHGGRDYAAFANAMARKGFALFVVDWPGHGSSPAEASDRSASAERYADLLAELIPGLCLDTNPILIGNSIGGAAALSFALRSPDKVRALVLCNPGGLAPLNALARIVIAGMVQFFAAGERGARWFPRAFAAYYHLVLPGKPAASHRARITAAGPEMAPLLKQAWDSFRQPDADLSTRAASLAVPTLFAWARQDRIVAWSRSKQAVHAITGAEVAMFRGGHCAFLEDPEAFDAAFLSFVERIKC